MLPRFVHSNNHHLVITDNLQKTYESYKSNDYPSLGLVSGTLRAYSKEGAWWTNATMLQNGGALAWVMTMIFPIDAPQIYSSVKTTNQYSLLAVNGFYDLWSLCPSFQQMTIFYNVSETTLRGDYDPKQCYCVLINIIPTS